MTIVVTCEACGKSTSYYEHPEIAADLLRVGQDKLCIPCVSQKRLNAYVLEESLFHRLWMNITTLGYYGSRNYRPARTILSGEGIICGKVPWVGAWEVTAGNNFYWSLFADPIILGQEEWQKLIKKE